MKCIKENGMKSIICMILVGIFSLNGVCAMQSPTKKRIVNTVEKRPPIIYEFTWREACAASAVLSGPLATVLAGAHAYNYGLSLPTSIMCSVGTVVTYGLILKSIIMSH